jgi:predicted SAM-dependent methyltransferase
MSLFDNQKIGVAFCSPHRKIRLPNGEEIVDTITVQWHRSRCALAYGTNINHVEFFCDGMEIGAARTRAARRCLEHKPTPQYLFFLDDDVLPNYDAFTKLFFHAQTKPEYDVFAGVYCCKGGNPPEPLIYSGDGGGPFWDWTVGDLLTTDGHGITGVHMGLTLIRTSLFQRMLDAGVCTDGEDDETPWFKTVKGTWKTPEGAVQSRAGTEDLFFCKLLHDPKVQAKILVDTSVLAGHVDKNTGITWGIPDNSPPVLRAKWLQGKDRAEVEHAKHRVLVLGDADGSLARSLRTGRGFDAVGLCVEQNGRHAVETLCQWAEHIFVAADGADAGLPAYCRPKIRQAVSPDDFGLRVEEIDSAKKPTKIAIDLGAGGRRREWPDHKTYTLDIRPESKPDYCQDSRQLNLPDNHFDLVASSHHLEHLGRWDQEKVWSEAFRVCKFGGLVEMTVPSVEWAAYKLTYDGMDQYVMDVLYGAQEAHGYERMYNTHFFGYTKSVGKALAEAAGFVEVVCTDWRDDENKAYEMTITGRKPTIDELKKAAEELARTQAAIEEVNEKLPAMITEEAAAELIKTDASAFVKTDKTLIALAGALRGLSIEAEDLNEVLSRERQGDVADAGTGD